MRFLHLGLALVSITFAMAGCASNQPQPAAGTEGGIPNAQPLVVSAAAPRPRIGTWSVNYWTWPISYGNAVAGTETAVAALKPTMIRVGGYNNDANIPDPFNDAEFDRMMAYARAIGAEPIVQVPLLQDTQGRIPSPSTAAAMVSYANVAHDYKVRYFSVGNEPDLYAMQGLPSNPALPARPSYSPADYCAAARDFVPAMKAVDPTIKILGPDLSYQYQANGPNWLSPILSGCGDLFDIVAIHRYPFSAPQATLAGASADVNTFRSVIASVRNLMQAAGQGSKPLAITEMNIAYDATPAGTSPTGAPGTVASGLWLADAVGTSLDLNLWTTAAWDISDPDQYSLGMIGLPPAHALRPEYYAYALYADHYGPSLVDVTTAPSGVNAYASRNASGNATEIIAVNWNGFPTPVSFRVTGLATAPAPVDFELPPLSMTAVELGDGKGAAAWTYGGTQHAAGSAPQALAPGVSSASSDAGSPIINGLDATADAPKRCVGAPVSGALITTMGRASGTGVMYGSSTSQWGSYTYAGSGQMSPSISVTSDGNGLQIAASFVAPLTSANNFEGVGLYFSNTTCLDASGYMGVQFDLSGDLGGCALAFGVSFSEDTAVENDPVRGSCTAGAAACYPPAAPVPSNSSTTIQVPFSTLSSGMPLGSVDPTTLIGVQWQLAGPQGADAGGCSANFEVSNVAFY